MVFHWSLSDSKSPQVSRTRLSILAVLSNAVVWIVSTRPPISKSSRPFNNPLVTVPKAPITIGTIVTFMFHSFFFISLARSRYLSFFSRFFRFILWSTGTAKSTILQILVFLLIIMRSGLLAGNYYYYYYYYFNLFRIFNTSISWWSFHRILSDNKCPEVSRTLLNNLADLNSTVVWIVSSRVFISDLFQSLYHSFVAYTECTDYNWYHSHFPVPYFFTYLARSIYLFLFSPSFNLIQ